MLVLFYAQKIVEIGLVVSLFGWLLLLDGRGYFGGVGLELFDIGNVLCLLVDVEVLLGGILDYFLFFERAFAIALGGFCIRVGICKLVILFGLVVENDWYLRLWLFDGLLRLLYFDLWLVGLSLSISETQIEFRLFLLLILGDFRLNVL